MYFAEFQAYFDHRQPIALTTALYRRRHLRLRGRSPWQRFLCRTSSEREQCVPCCPGGCSFSLHWRRHD